MLERRHVNHETGLLQRGDRGLRVAAIELRLDAHQHVGLARLFEHLARIGAGWQSPGNMATHHVGCLAQETDRCVRQFAQFESQRM